MFMSKCPLRCCFTEKLRLDLQDYGIGITVLPCVTGKTVTLEDITKLFTRQNKVQLLLLLLLSQQKY